MELLTKAKTPLLISAPVFESRFQVYINPHGLYMF